MDARDIPIDTDAFVVHQLEKYVEALEDIMEANDFWPDTEQRRRSKK